MRRIRRSALWAATALAVAGVVAIVASDPSGDDPESRSPGVASASMPAPRAPDREVLLIRRRGGVPADLAGRLRRVSGVRAIASMGRTQALVTGTRSARGRVVDAAPAGYAFPLDVLVIRPRAYARVLPEAGSAIRALRGGTALLSQTSARLRRLDVGDRLTLAGGRPLRVAGIVDDDVVRTAELVLTPADAGPSSGSQLAVATKAPARIERMLRRDEDTRVRRYSDGGPSPALIARPAETKDRFGEFTVRLPYGEDWIAIDPGWRRRFIIARTVPILGSVTCHRRFIPPLRRALGELERRGLSHLVDPGDYAGCYAPRRIPGSGSLSLHAWGLAIDLNAAANPPLGPSRQDPRLVATMERAGFTWGGRWPTVSDPMHFELHEVPRDE
jgi:D-alanyl-D-alanine carboxypeptidase